MVTIVEALCVQKHLDDARACTLCILSAVDVAAATHVLCIYIISSSSSVDAAALRTCMHVLCTLSSAVDVAAALCEE